MAVYIYHDVSHTPIFIFDVELISLLDTSGNIYYICVDRSYQYFYCDVTFNHTSIGSWNELLIFVEL